MRLTTRQTLKRCLIAVAATLAGLLAMGGTASAVVSEAPEITAQPSSPNTTHAVVSFTYKVSDDETSEAATLRYYCRVYDADDTPPAAGTGWAACGTTTSTDPQPASKTYAQANGDWIFEVAVRESPSITTQGPIADFPWAQNIAAPVEAPAITSQPEDPSNVVSSSFEFAAASGEADLVNLFQCRIDSSEESAWTACNSGARSYVPGNGEHTFDVRAGNAVGYGPTASYTWTVDIPNASPSVKLEDVATTRWDGRVASQALGGDRSYNGYGMTSAGDINGDGRVDILVSGGYSDAGTYVLFNSGRPRGDRVVADLQPSDGYEIRLPAGNTPWAYTSIGDQNGDGVPDLALEATSFTTTANIYVIYGTKDPSSLPLCSDSTVMHCLDLATLTDTQGYILNGIGSGRGQTIRSLVGAGDFDGDGIGDLIAGASNNINAAYIIKGGVRSGSVDITTLPTDQVLQINGLAGGSYFGSEGARPLGDVNDDGIDDVFIASYAEGGGYILYGYDWSSSPINIADFTSDDGIRVFAPSLSVSNVTNIGDVNRDGRPDLAAVTMSGTLFSEEEQSLSIVYGPEQPATDPIVFGPDLAEGGGYVVSRGGVPAELGAVTLNAGDLNNDGVPDSLTSAPRTVVDGLTAGGAYLLFGQNPVPGTDLGVGPDLTADLGVAMLGADGEGAGRTVVPLDDLDGDGLPDFAVGAPSADPNGVSNAGSVYVVPGKALINQVKTGKAAGVANTSAVLNAGVSTNNRDSEVWFEYGTTSDYGSSTDPESFEGSVAGDAASAAVSGLAKATTYHYRAVAKNALGLVRYGDDRTFTTANADNPGDPCVDNPGAAGCSTYCEVNPTAMGCPDYDWCANNPGKCNNGGGKTKARLALIATQKRIALKRGRKGVLRVAVVNTGGKQAKGVKVCVKAPKRLVKVKRCVKVGKLASGKSRIVKIKVKAKRKRGKAVLKLTAKGSKLSAKRAKARVVVR